MFNANVTQPRALDAADSEAKYRPKNRNKESLRDKYEGDYERERLRLRMLFDGVDREGKKVAQGIDNTKRSSTNNYNNNNSKNRRGDGDDDEDDDDDDGAEGIEDRHSKEGRVCSGCWVLGSGFANVLLGASRFVQGYVIGQRPAAPRDTNNVGHTMEETADV
eukprot:PhF_6_TR37076/c1_g1_i3/m.54323